MNATTRFLLGVLSSALLAVGFARAADHLDPVSRTLPAKDAIVADSAPFCDTECNIA